MNAISNGLALQVLRTYSIPTYTNWGQTVSSWTMRPISQILTNNRGYARLFFYDQGSWLNGNLPFSQGQAGTAAGVPASARIAIVSTIARALPYANGALSTANFNSLWNVVPGAVPAYLAGWSGNGNDLVIQRFSVDPLFHHLILTTRDSSTAAGYSINSVSTYSAVPNGAAGTNTYFLDGTTVGLWVNGTLTNRFVLTRDTSFTFEAGTWRDQLTGSGTDNSETAQSFSIQAAMFAQAGIPGGHQGADTQGALSSFYDFMLAYTIWANKCPHFQFIGNGTQDADYQILNTLGAGGTAGIINGATGSSGGGLLQ